MEWWQAVILGLVEGITEYLPVSSTGHLILASSLMRLDTESAKASLDSFLVVIQGGAILAVLGLYWPRVRQMLLGLIGRDPAGLRLALNLIVAFIPAAALGFLLHDLIEKWLFHPWPVLAALFVGGAWMIWLRRRHSPRDASPLSPVPDSRAARPELTIETLDWGHSLAIGLLQCVAMWPGTSRSMMTIAGGTMLGLKPRQAAEFSFLLGLPTLGAACAYSLFKNFKHAHDSGTPNLFKQLGAAPVLIGIVVAAIAAAIAVKWLVAFLTRHGLASFGVYRIAFSIALGALVLTKIVHIGG